MRAARLREAAVPAPQQPQYQRRRPEQTLLYRLVRQHYATFAAGVEHACATGLPPFVKEEFDAYLDCGILAKGSCACVETTAHETRWWRLAASAEASAPRAAPAEWPGRRRI